jgi:hypothetical protein
MTQREKSVYANIDVEVDMNIRGLIVLFIKSKGTFIRICTCKNKTYSRNQDIHVLLGI